MFAVTPGTASIGRTVLAARLGPSLHLNLRGALLDGEMVVMDAEGRTSFSGLHDALARHGAGIRFVAFDLLHLDGVDLRTLPLVQPKERL
jgi:bifunctional non-homologous end joining protein LigD